MIRSTTEHHKRALLISYAFPPVGGAGVQRMLKFTKYLPDYGWLPTVLTVANPSVPVTDPRMLDEVPKNVEVVRARTLEPNYRFKSAISSNTKAAQRNGAWQWIKNRIRSSGSRFLQPDPQVLWNPQAYRVGRRALREGSFRAIVVSGPPFSSFLLGASLKKLSSLPLILDFRDEWMLASQYLENHAHSNSGLQRQRRYFEDSILAADAIIATTKASANELEQSVHRIGSPAVVRTIYNGFDPSDLTLSTPLAMETSDTRPFHLVYTGTLWRLTDVRPLLKALHQLEQSDPHSAKQIKVTFCGRRTHDQEQYLTDFTGASRIPIDRIEYLPHEQALGLAGSASALCLLLADEPGAERIVPGKLFEYLAMRKPILAIAPEGETSRLLREHHEYPSFLPTETSSMVAWITQQIQSRHPVCQAPQISPRRALPSLDWCSRPILTQQLAELLEQLDPIPSDSNCLKT